LISTVVMFQAHNKEETIINIWEVAVSFKIIMTTNVEEEEGEFIFRTKTKHKDE